MVSFHVIWKNMEVASHCKYNCWRRLWKSSLIAVHAVAWLNLQFMAQMALQFSSAEGTISGISFSLNLEPCESAFLSWTDVCQSLQWTVKFTHLMENYSVLLDCFPLLSEAEAGLYIRGKGNVHLWSQWKQRQRNQHIHLFRVKSQLSPSCNS